MMGFMTLSTHVLDATTGRPAVGVAVTLTAAGTAVADGLTDADGRIQYRRDIYDRDARLFEALRAAGVAFPELQG